MQPEERDPAYLWDMLQAAREVETMLEDHDQIDYELLYKTAVEDIPALITQLRGLLPPLEEDEP